MSTRERWIVYPLLFLALGTAIKPKLVPAERVSCRTLDVVDNDLRTRIRMTAATPSLEGEIKIANRLGKPVVVLRADAATQAGAIETLNTHGQVQTAMTSSAGGSEGEIKIANRLGKPVVVLRADAAAQAGVIETLNTYGQVQTAMTSSAGGSEGEIKINNQRGKPAVMLRGDAATRAGLVETLSDEGKLQTVMMSSATGGEIAALDHESRNTVVIGHRDGRFGLIQTNLANGSFAFVPISKLAALVRLVP